MVQRRAGAVRAAVEGKGQGLVFIVTEVELEVVERLHAAGAGGAPQVLAAVPGELEAPYVVLPYIDDMGAAYAAADLALCRSGAMTCRRWQRTWRIRLRTS